MAIQWSDEQKKVIELRDRNMLVSAAAGSGKTAVLVQRIIEKITSKERPVDIDRLLVVTFTKAAAAEMRERISLAIEKMLESDPDDENLLRQLTLVHNAQITTIDSFCLYVIRNYFHKIDLEPGFRVADQNEITLMKTDILEELLEDRYERGDAEFIDLVNNYSGVKSDADIGKMVSEMYHKAQSDPWPEKWLRGLSDKFDIKGLEDMEAKQWVKELIVYIKTYIEGLIKDLEKLLKVCAEENGPIKYLENITNDMDILKKLLTYDTYQELYSGMAGIGFSTLNNITKKDACDQEKKNYVKEKRDSVKKAVEKIKADFFFEEPQQACEKLQAVSKYVDTFVKLALEFSDRLQEEKRNKNMLDFNDMEHFALNILVDPETERPTDTAAIFREHFEEIMIDEYQDSNYVQEAILTSISNGSNIFMVGDVKQSIYRFRQAKPELFMGKYESYTLEDGKDQRIDLHKNYRSRKEIVDTVNDVFYSIMHKDLGNVVYDEQSALYQGAQYPEPEDVNQFQTELLLIDNKSGEESDTKAEVEAKVIAAKIKELMNTQKVSDKDTGSLRPLKYSDIVILMRSTKEWADVFVEVLGDLGIPACTLSNTGYFSATEIETLLNMLRVVDNPKQDIPLTSVLTSIIVGLSGDELAQIKVAYRDIPFYQAVKKYADEHGGDPLGRKLYKFYELIEDLRKKTTYMTIHELIEEVLKVTGYEQYVASLPSGERKAANIRMLVEKAIAYEATSYRGLFHFLRYIEKMHKYEVDFGEADILSDADDTVRITTIHKSKGLEYPVVILAATGKAFNRSDTIGKMIFHPEIGAGISYIDADNRIISDTLMRAVIANRIKLENLGEELRVLYVALTRAKERLIITGIKAKAQETMDKISMGIAVSEDNYQMSLTDKISVSGYMDWILPVFARNRVRYKIQVIDELLVENQDMTDAVNQAYRREAFNLKVEQVNKELYEDIEKRLSYVYPYAHDIELKGKLSVSEIKHQAMEDVLKEEDAHQIFNFEEEQETVPAFMKQEIEVNKGALRGSALHKAMEIIDFKAVYNRLSKERQEQISNADISLIPKFDEKERKQIYFNVKEQLEDRTKTGLMPQDMYEILYVGNVSDFFTTPLAMRMHRAAMAGKLRKERPFVMGIPASEVEDTQSEELVLIQGIVDAFFEENNEIVVVDYKTDGVEVGDELIKRYSKQLELYSRALEKITQLPVKEQILYSTRLKSEVIIS